MSPTTYYYWRLTPEGWVVSGETSHRDSAIHRRICAMAAGWEVSEIQEYSRV